MLPHTLIQKIVGGMRISKCIIVRLTIRDTPAIFEWLGFFIFVVPSFLISFINHADLIYFIISLLNIKLISTRTHNIDKNGYMEPDDLI